MVGRINISRRAEAVRQLFMSLEQHAKKLKTCWLCGAALSTIKIANQGHLSGNHAPHCVFERLALAGEKSIIARDESDAAKQIAENELAQRVEEFSIAIESIDKCPLCQNHIRMGHQIGCALKGIQQVRALS